MSETPRSVVRTWILVAVVDLGERALRQAVHARIRELYQIDFTPADLLLRVGRHGEAAWQNNVDSLYDHMKHAGEMRRSSRGDPWQLGPSVLAEARFLHSQQIGTDDSEDLLAEFKPRTSDEYLSRIIGREISKRRDHEDTLKRFGEAMAGSGWRASTLVHPRDLELTHSERVCLVEVKQVYRGDATAATREALAQLLEYAHYFYSATQRPELLAVFSEPIGSAHADFLDSLAIASVWRIGDDWWDGSSLAKSRKMVPKSSWRH